VRGVEPRTASSAVDRRGACPPPEPPSRSLCARWPRAPLHHSL